ncbi:MAG: V-type ATPase subunit [Oligosphaeraceae bacterium]|nr:V-type ATPase subunit [Oligosphaeraceae bacterium]
MRRFPLSTGSDFIFARLHGLISRAAVGERLRHLTSCVTEELFFQALANLGYDFDPKDNFQKQLMLRETRCLEDLMLWSSPAVARYLAVVIRTLNIESLKLLLSYRFQERLDLEPAELLTSLPGQSGYDYKALLEIEGDEQFIEQLPDCQDFPELGKVIARLAEDRDFMTADCAIDSFCFKSEMEQAKKLPLSMRNEAVELLSREIDVSNLSMLLRNVNMYHITPERLQKFWIPGGKFLSLSELNRLAIFENPGLVIEALPSPFAALLKDCREKELYHSEQALWNWLAKRVWQIFMDFSHPALSVVAYPYLLRFENINLGRIYEGIRFALPPNIIQEMMIAQGL